MDQFERRVDKLEGHISDILTRLAVAESNISDIKEDLSSIKSNTSWILKLIIGTIVVGVLGLIINGGM